LQKEEFGERREFIPETFVFRDQHPLEVMTWGAIGPGGWRSKLIRCPFSLNTTLFLEMLIESGIIAILNGKIGARFDLFFKKTMCLRIQERLRSSLNSVQCSIGLQRTQI
jgi:hypothetical protein